MGTVCLPLQVLEELENNGLIGDGATPVTVLPSAFGQGNDGVLPENGLEINDFLKGKNPWEGEPEVHDL